MARRYYVQLGQQRIPVPGPLAAAQRHAKAIANRFRCDVMLAYDAVRSAAPKPKRYARNPMMGGVNFTGEEWLTVGFGPRGRLAVISNSRREAEKDADYLHALGYRALTTRRVKASVDARQGRSARRATK